MDEVTPEMLAVALSCAEKAQAEHGHKGAAIWATEAALAAIKETSGTQRPQPSGDEVEQIAKALCKHFDEDWTITGPDWVDAARAALAAMDREPIAVGDHSDRLARRMGAEFVAREPAPQDATLNETPTSVESGAAGSTDVEGPQNAGEVTQADTSGHDIEMAAWDWLEHKFGTENDDPVDRAYDASEMVDAFHAGHARHRQSAADRVKALEEGDSFLVSRVISILEKDESIPTEILTKVYAAMKKGVSDAAA